MSKLRHGHAPGHVRETFGEAVEAFLNWKPGQPEPTVDYEIHYVPHKISLSKACGLVWNCTDILPALYADYLAADLPMQSRTYAAAARAMLDSIKQQQRLAS